MRKLKAASFIFEQVMLFLMGVVIFTACFFVFQSYQSYFEEISVRNQLNEIKDAVISYIIKLAEGGKDTISYIKIKFCRPPGSNCFPYKVGNEDYLISLSDDGVNVTAISSGITVHSDVYLLNISLDGTVYSSAGDFVIYKSGNKIIIK